jgi:hypothetical protein
MAAQGQAMNARSSVSSAWKSFRAAERAAVASATPPAEPAASGKSVALVPRPIPRGEAVGARRLAEAALQARICSGTGYREGRKAAIGG